ncbi:MAG: YbbR-like domain-containing protein [Thermodesulfobacteriota bacterium]
MRGWLTHNLGLKALSLLLAAGLWFFVAGQSSMEVGFFVPLGFSGIPGDMVMTTAPAGEVEVRIRGPKLVINNVTASKISANLDLSGASEGLNKYRVEAENIDVPTGVTVTSVKPGSVRFRLERIMRKTVIVKAMVSGKPAKGYKVEEISVIPKTVEAAGLKKDVLPLRRLFAEPVSLNGLKETTVQKVNITYGEHDLRSVNPETVKVMVIIKEVTKK